MSGNFPSHRGEWLLDEEITFLNHGSFGACPKVVLAEQARLREQMEREPVRFLWREIEQRLDSAREVLARFLHADAADIAFVSNATSAVNAVVKSLELAPGDELLIADHGYNACRNVLEETARRQGARVTVAKVPFPIASPDEVTSAMVNAMTSRTRLVLLDHITSPTALVFPVEKIVRHAEERGISVLVDGAHAPGMLPINLRELGASYYTGNLHKWVCAPKGAAFLYARRDRQRSLHPSTLSHGYNTPRVGRSSFHDEFDWQGTLDVTAWLAVPTAIAFCEGLVAGGFHGLMKRNRDLAIEARKMLSHRLGLSMPCPESMIGSMATLPLPDKLQDIGNLFTSRFDPLQTRLFENHRIEVPLIRFAEKKWFRISAHAHNDLPDYARLAEALEFEAAN
jgi:isopenicillin-N epimerase